MSSPFVSKTAFEFSVERFYKGFSRAYLWTFTLPEVLGIREFRHCWYALGRALARYGFQGIRTFELHPSGHGFHVHVICRQRYPVRVIRIFALAAGFGRIHVVQIPIKEASYVGKYISKQTREWCMRGMRLWAGIRFQCNKVVNVVAGGVCVTRYWKQFSDEFISKCHAGYESAKGYQRHLIKLSVCEWFVYLGESISDFMTRCERMGYSYGY